jgi:hypothetical protein
MEHRWTAGARLIANQIDRAKARVTLTYRFLADFSAGLEYNPLAASVSPLANWRAVDETEKMPAFIFGTSSDRIGTPYGQSYYATASKSLEGLTGWPVAPYLGAAYGTYDDKLRVIGGLNIEFTPRYGALLIFDGVHMHSTFNISFRRQTITLLLVNNHDPGVSYSFIF